MHDMFSSMSIPKTGDYPLFMVDTDEMMDNFTFYLVQRRVVSAHLRVKKKG